jgi:tRNA-binding protein
VTEERIDAAAFDRVDMRVGVIREVLEFPEARRPSYKIRVDFGDELGDRWSVAQAPVAYPDRAALVGRQVIGVVNLEPMRIARFKSEVLLLGVHGEDGELALLRPDRDARVGDRVY